MTLQAESPPFECSCFTVQDLVIPPMCSPQKYSKSPMLGAPARERTILGFFKGRIQPNNPRYSRGIRQFLAKHSGVADPWPALPGN